MSTQPGRPGFSGSNSTGFRPTCSCAFEAETRNLLATTFDRTGADKVAKLAKTGIIHTFLVVGEVSHSIVNWLSSARDYVEQLTIVDQGFNLALP